jgi:hypothetical protein
MLVLEAFDEAKVPILQVLLSAILAKLQIHAQF